MVMKITGVMDFWASAHAEIENVRRFERKQSLVLFAGVDPMPKQSGEKNVRSNKSSKRGSPIYTRRCST